MGQIHMLNIHHETKRVFPLYMFSYIWYLEKKKLKNFHLKTFVKVMIQPPVTLNDI